MAVQLDPSGKDDKNEIKTHFVTREGVYRTISSEEFVNRPRPGVGYQGSPNQTSPQVRVSFVSLPQSGGGSAPAAASAPTAVPTLAATATSAASNNSSNGSQDGTSSGGQDRIAFNLGKELYIYSFKGLKKVRPPGSFCHI